MKQEKEELLNKLKEVHKEFMGEHQRFYDIHKENIESITPRLLKISIDAVEDQIPILRSRVNKLERKMKGE